MITPFFSPNVGGVETHLDDLTEYLAENGFFIHVITYKTLTGEKVNVAFSEKKRNVRILRLPWLRYNLFYRLENKPIFQFLYLFPGIFFLSFLYLLANLRRIRIIHGHGLAAAVATLILSKFFFKRGIVSLHTIYKFSERPALAAVVKRILSPLHHIMVLAKGCKDDLINIGIDKDKISVYTCWVDNTKKFIVRDKNECRKMLGLPPDKFVVLFVGRLSPEKGVAIVLDVVKRMLNKEILFVLVGDGPMMLEVKKAAETHSNIVASGSVLNENLKFYYNASDILLFGSVDHDYYGRVTMEALSSGLPVILPDRTSYFCLEKKVEIDFPHNEIGYMISPEPSRIMDKIEYIFNNPPVLALMQNKDRTYALEHFSKKNATIFMDAYRNAAQNME